MSTDEIGRRTIALGLGQYLIQVGVYNGAPCVFVEPLPEGEQGKPGDFASADHPMNGRGQPVPNSTIITFDGEVSDNIAAAEMLCSMIMSAAKGEV